MTESEFGFSAWTDIFGTARGRDARSTDFLREPGEQSVDNEAYQRGYEAQKQDLGFLDNPYDSYSDEGRRWIDGYVKSMQDQRALRTGAEL